MIDTKPAFGYKEPLDITLALYFCIWHSLWKD